MKMNKFHKVKIMAYPHKRLNKSRGIMRSKELHYSMEEIKTELKRKQRIVDI